MNCRKFYIISCYRYVSKWNDWKLIEKYILFLRDRRPMCHSLHSFHWTIKMGSCLKIREASTRISLYKNMVFFYWAFPQSNHSRHDEGEIRKYNCRYLCLLARLNLSHVAQGNKWESDCLNFLRSLKKDNHLLETLILKTLWNCMFSGSTYHFHVNYRRTEDLSESLRYSTTPSSYMPDSAFKGPLLLFQVSCQHTACLTEWWKETCVSR